MQDLFSFSKDMIVAMNHTYAGTIIIDNGVCGTIIKVGWIIQILK